MAEYRVTWVVEVEADSPAEAALVAEGMMRDPPDNTVDFRVAQGRSMFEVEVDLRTMQAGVVA